MLPSRRWRRVLAPLLLVIEVALVVVFAVVAVVGLVAALFDRRRRLLGTGVFGVVYFGVEITALLGCLWAWLSRAAHPPSWWEDYHYRLLRWVLGTLVTTARWSFGFRIEVVDNPDPGPLERPEPVLVLARHGGVGDSFSLAWLLLARYDRRVRVVLKEILQWEPLLDVVLNRVGACFLPAEAGHGEALASRLGTLCAGLGPRDALLLFPEGRNWTPGRWERAIRRLGRDRKQEAARAASLMTHVLPPRPGGVLACVDARPGLSVVVVAHTGLDKLTTTRQIWDALPFDRPMTVRWWPAPGPPEGAEARLQWLTTEWAVVDQWIDARSAGVL